MYSAPASPEPVSDSDAEATLVDTFAGVPPMLVAALRKRGFAQLTEVQKAVVAADDGVRDLRISSQTGSGKTVALGFALAYQLRDDARRGPTTLIVTPTRELAAQVKEELGWLFADLPNIRCEVVTGGTSIVRERQQLRVRPSVLVGTPGRLLDHLRTGALDLGSVRQLVLDEADQMLDLGFKDELDGILEQLPAKRRTHLVSATFPTAVRALADRFQNDALLIAGSAAGAAHGDIEHIAIKCGAREHYAVLVNLLLLAGDERTLVFVRTREDTTALADKLAADGFLALPINGDLAQAQRTRTLQAFRRGAIHTLIATDVAARGLDISDVTTVVHVDPPIDSATYVHRSGRTGRAGQKGRSCMLVVKSRESRTRRLYYSAKVEPSWEGGPGAEEVVAHQLERAIDRAEAALSVAGSGTPAQRAAAAQLLEGRDAQSVVAVLLAQAASGVRAPFAIAGARPMPARRASEVSADALSQPAAKEHAAKEHAPKEHAPKEHAGKEHAPKHAAKEHPPQEHAVKEPTKHAAKVHAAKEHVSKVKAQASTVDAPTPAPRRAEPAAEPVRRLSPAQRGRPGSLPSWRREPVAAASMAEPGFQRFRINWGSRDGADPRRVLAHVCRRGGLESHMVGAISVQMAATTFEVASAAVPHFAKKVQARDRRDPHLVIVADRPKPRAADLSQDAAADD